MVIVLLEHKIYHIESLVDKIHSSFPMNSILKVNRKNIYDMQKLLKTTPLLTDGWAIIISDTVSIEQALAFCKDDNNVVVICTKPNRKNDAIVALGAEEIKFSIVDNIKVGEEALRKYVSERLHIDNKLAITLCNRCNNYLPYVLEGVSLLETLGRQVERKDVTNFIDKRSGVNIYSLFKHLIGYINMDESTVATYLYDFRFAFPYIKKELLKYIDDTINIFSLIESGHLAGDNYKTFNYGFKVRVSDYVLKSLILDVHESVSLELVILLKVKIQKCDSMYQLLNCI